MLQAKILYKSLWRVGKIPYTLGDRQKKIPHFLSRSANSFMVRMLTAILNLMGSSSSTAQGLPSRFSRLRFSSMLILHNSNIKNLTPVQSGTGTYLLVLTIMSFQGPVHIFKKKLSNTFCMRRIFSILVHSCPDVKLKSEYYLFSNRRIFSRIRSFIATPAILDRVQN